MRTPTQALADHLLRQPVEDWIRERRDQSKSWRRISLELRDVTKGKIDVGERTITSWVSETPADQPAPAAP